MHKEVRSLAQGRLGSGGTTPKGNESQLSSPLDCWLVLLQCDLYYYLYCFFVYCCTIFSVYLSYHIQEAGSWLVSQSSCKYKLVKLMQPQFYAMIRSLVCPFKHHYFRLPTGVLFIQLKDRIDWPSTNNIENLISMLLTNDFSLQSPTTFCIALRMMKLIFSIILTKSQFLILTAFSDNMPVTWCYKVQGDNTYCATGFPIGCFVDQRGTPKDACVIEVSFNSNCRIPLLYLSYSNAEI